MVLGVFKKWDENCTAVLLSFTVIGLLVLLKIQEDKIIARDQEMIATETNIVTYID
mgnify:CR=1 FL=1